LKAALLGATHPHSSLHLKTFKRSDEVEEVLFWDPVFEAATALAALLLKTSKK
jgi:hypothetical protein